MCIARYVVYIFKKYGMVHIIIYHATQIKQIFDAYNLTLLYQI